MANTGVGNWLVRGLAIVIGLVCVVTMTVATIGTGLVVLAVVGIAHRYRRQKGRPLTLLQSYLTAIITMSIVVASLFAVLLAQRQKTGKTFWDGMVATSDSIHTHPQPVPRVLRYLPGGNIQPTPMPRGFNITILALGFFLAAEMVGGFLGTLLWGSMWLLISGWTGQLAGIHRVVDEGRAPA